MSKDYCPLVRGKCKEHKCKFFIEVLGTNPNTGSEISNWDCAVAWLPILMIENSQQQRQTGAAVESFRNEMVQSNAVSQAILAANMQEQTPALER